MNKLSYTLLIPPLKHLLLHPSGSSNGQQFMQQLTTAEDRLLFGDHLKQKVTSEASPLKVTKVWHPKLWTIMNSDEWANDRHKATTQKSGFWIVCKQDHLHATQWFGSAYISQATGGNEGWIFEPSQRSELQGHHVIPCRLQNVVCWPVTPPTKLATLVQTLHAKPLLKADIRTPYNLSTATEVYLFGLGFIGWQLELKDSTFTLPVWSIWTPQTQKFFYTLQRGFFSSQIRVRVCGRIRSLESSGIVRLAGVNEQ